MLRIAIFVVVALGALLVAGVIQKRYRRVRSISANLLITYTVIALMLGGGELYFRYVYAESDGLPTFALTNWLDRYWRTNSLGFRDREWTAADWEGKTTVIAIGDSFTAGWGIDDPNDRWSNVLAAHLGDDYAVINLGMPSATTVWEIETLENYPLQNPDVVIWQYTLNDIDHAALSIGQNPNMNPMDGVPTWAELSALGNFIFWRLATPEIRMGDIYVSWHFQMYDTPMVWDIHVGYLQDVIDTVESTGARLIPVIFPDMQRPFDSIPYVDRVAQVFEARGYEPLRLFDQAESMPLNERIVSVRDAHPSAAFNRVVGDLLYERYFANAP